MSDALREELWERTLLPTPAGIEAAELLERSRSALAAELLLRGAAHQAAASHGPGSPEHCALSCELGDLYARMGDASRAREAYRLASRVMGGEEVERDRLTARLLLARALLDDGLVEEGAAILAEDLVARRTFYGEEHPATAIGLRELGEALLRCERPAEAFEAADEALELLAEAEESGELLPTLALVMECAVAAGETLEEELDGLEPGSALDLALLVAERAAEAPAARATALLGEVSRGIERALGPDHPAVTALLAAWPEQVDPAERAARLARLVTLAAGRGQTLGAISAGTALARALADAGRTDEALRAAAEATARARELPARGGRRARAIALARRAEGRLLERFARASDALAAFEEAAVAARDLDPELLGPALADLGRSLAAQGEHDLARANLEEALGLLAPADPATLPARAALVGLDPEAPRDPEARVARARDLALVELARAALEEAAAERLAPPAHEEEALASLRAAPAGRGRWSAALSQPPASAELRALLELAGRHALLQLGLAPA